MTPTNTSARCDSASRTQAYKVIQTLMYHVVHVSNKRVTIAILESAQSPQWNQNDLSSSVQSVLGNAPASTR